MGMTFETRKENLRRLVRDRFEGNRAALARAAEVHPNHINLLLSENPDHRRNMGETLARKIEEKLHLATGFLDQTHGQGAEIEIRAVDPPPEFGGLFIRNNVTTCVKLNAEYIEAFRARITKVENLGLMRLMSSDLDPDVPRNTAVVVDTGYRAFTDDGFYILSRNGSVFVRRVTAQLSGGFTISGGGEPVHLDNLKGIKVAGRLVLAMVSRAL